jgi:hypothetical protein
MNSSTRSEKKSNPGSQKKERNPGGAGPKSRRIGARDKRVKGAQGVANSPAGDGSQPVIAVVEGPLDTLIAHIKEALHEGNGIRLRLRKAGVEAIHWAHRVGGMLIEAKPRRGKVSWETWVEDTFDLSEKLANNYMRVARGWDIVEPMLDANPNSDSEITLTAVLKALEKPRKKAGPRLSRSSKPADCEPAEGTETAEAAEEPENPTDPETSEDPAGNADPGQGDDARNTNDTSVFDAASGNSLHAGSESRAVVQAFVEACKVIDGTYNKVIAGFYVDLEPEYMPTILSIVKQARPYAKEVGKCLMEVEKFLRKAMKDNDKKDT